MRFLSSERLSPHKHKTSEGYLVCVDAILARTGSQQYRRSEVFADSDDDTIIDVDRTAEEVFSPETLASFENKPITVEHPSENVTAENYNELSVGFVRDVHRGTVDGQEVMLGTLVITDATAIEEIENGEHVELSCGYDCDIVDEAHPQQRNIRGNHVALCEQGRAGIARIVDSVSNKVIGDSVESDFEDITNMSDAKELLKRYGIDLIKKDNRNYVLRKGSKDYTFYVLDNPNEVRKDLIRAVKKLTMNDSKVRDAYVYLFAKSDMKSRDILEAKKYNLEVLGTNKFGSETNLVVKGDLNNLKRFAKEYLAYELHPDYLYKENEFAGSIVKDCETKDADKFTFKLSKKKNEYDEYVIRAYKNGKYYEDASYYTDDWDDAVGTLKDLAKRQGQTVTQRGSVYVADTKIKDVAFTVDVSKATNREVSQFITNAQNVGFTTKDKGFTIELLDGNETMLRQLKSKMTTTSIKFNDVKDEKISGPRGTFTISEKSKKELEAEGYGYHHSFEKNGKTYHVMTKNNIGVACTDAINGKLKDLNVKEFVEKAFSYGNVHTDRSNNKGDIDYIIFIDPYENGSAWLDVIEEKYNNDYDADDFRHYNKIQTRVVSKKLNNKESLIKEIETVKNRFKDSERKFEFSYEDGDTTHIHVVKASSLEDAINKFTRRK